MQTFDVKSRKWIGIIALAVYFSAVAAVVGSMLYIRGVTLATLDTSKATAEWMKWRDDAASENQSGPVHRRPPKAIEPPAIILMRDHFVPCLVMAVVTTSLLFGVMLLVIHGVLQRVKIHP